MKPKIGLRYLFIIDLFAENITKRLLISNQFDILEFTYVSCSSLACTFSSTFAKETLLRLAQNAADIRPSHGFEATW